MIIKFLGFKDYDRIRDNGGRSAAFNAGFGLGRNVTHVMKANGDYYLKLSPIANTAYENKLQEVRDQGIIKQIKSLVG